MKSNHVYSYLISIDFYIWVEKGVENLAAMGSGTFFFFFLHILISMIMFFHSSGGSEPGLPAHARFCVYGDSYPSVAQQL